jgi:Mg2+ and Co2+ transporter CorA
MNSPHCNTSIWRPSAGITPVTEEEWIALAQKAAIPEAIIQRSREREQRARLMVCDVALLVTLRIWSGPTGSSGDDLDDVTSEWDLFVGSDFVLIRSDSPLPTLPAGTKTPSQVLYVLLDESIDSCYPAMDHMDSEIDSLEQEAYVPLGSIELAPALRLKKQLLLLRQTITPLRDVINQLLRLQHAVLDPALHPFLQDIFDRSLRLTEQIDLHRDILSGVLEAIMAQTSNRLNQQMKRLTAIAAVAVPITAITGFFGMNIGHFEKAPSWSLWVAITTMALASSTVLFYFRKKGYW